MALVAAAVLLVANARRGGDEASPAAAAPAPFTPVAVRAVGDHDPFGDDRSEHPEEARFVLDDDPATAWSTERYSSGSLAPKEGVGLYLDAGTPVAARRLDVRTPTPGFTVRVHASNQAPRPTAAAGAFAARWGAPLAEKTVDAKRSIALDTRRRAFRYYLVWIVSLPADAGGKAEIGTLRLLR